jgi:malonyl-CoA/methylmalonyl-CoA synthetase
MPKATMPDLIARAQQFGSRTAVIDANGSHSYDDLLDASSRIASQLLAGGNDLNEARVAFLIAPGFPWAATQWGIWRAGGIAVPLPVGTPWAELEYYLEDTRATALVCDATNRQVVPTAEDPGLEKRETWGTQSSQTKTISYDDALLSQPSPLPGVDNSRRAMILYTSGTTSRPKGVVTTHANISAQITSLVDAWEWNAEDRILLCLPLHHVHGIVNVVSCALWSGATCETLPRFDAQAVWKRIASGELTLFMAVPTIYVRLITAWEAAPTETRNAWSAAASRLRLMVSGSAALPVSTLERWREITGQTLLERYGMTEIGMALSNSYRGQRVPGSVGRPLAGVAVRLVNEGGEDVPSGTPGEIEIAGASVFTEYWSKPEATRDAFRDGWFRTGDTAIVENGVYRILGRSSVDILKTGGHKVSALEVEEMLREHPAIDECAVVGLADPEWGERVAVAVVLRGGHELVLEELRLWAKERIAHYKVPSRMRVLEALPRNAMGKVTKPAVKALFQ